MGASLATLAVPGSRAFADPVADFYSGKTVSIAVYGIAGSAYDVYARLLSRYMPNHLPGTPSMIVRNIPGAGGLTATRYLYFQAPKDGAVIGSISRGIPFEPLLGDTAVGFDPLKFVWLGSMEKETTIFISWHTSKVKTAQDLFTKDLLLAGTGAGADSEIVSRALNGILHTRIKIISGYQGASAAALALERGEIEGIYWTWNGINTAHPDWLRDLKLNLLFQTRSTPHPALPNVPLVMSLAKTDEQRQELALLFARDPLGRPFLAPPDVPADRVAALKKAFNDSINDPALKAEAAKAKMEIELVTGEEVTDIIRHAYETPKPIVEKVRKAMGR